MNHNKYIENWETLSKKIFWDRNVTLEKWRDGVTRGHRSYLPDSVATLTPFEFIHFYGSESFKKDWPRLKHSLPAETLNKSGFYDVIWSQLMGAGFNLKPVHDFYEMPEKRRLFLIQVAKFPGENIYGLAKMLGIQYRRAHDHADTLLMNGAIFKKEVIFNGRRQCKLYPSSQKSDDSKMNTSIEEMLKINTKMRYNRFWSNASLSDVTVDTYIAVYVSTPEMDDMIVLVKAFGYEKIVEIFELLKARHEIYEVNEASAARMLGVILEVRKERGVA